MPLCPRLPAYLGALGVALAAAPALADGRFEALRQKAEPLESLPGFTERYVGACKDPLDRATCEQNVRSGRKALEGRLYFTVIADRARDIVRVERRGEAFRFLLTPFVDAEGLALSHGEPRLDARGRPTVGLLVIDSVPGLDESLVAQAMRTGRVELEILFRAEGAWKLKRKGEAGFFEGIKGRFAAVRLLDGRTGTELAVKVLQP